MTEIVLAIENLKICHSSSGMVLVDDLSLDLRLGETLAIVGESGSGKSITALSVIRLLPNALEINEGSVTLEKDDIFELTENEMNEVRGRRIAMIFQEPQTSLNPVQTVGDQLREVISLHGNVLKPDDLTKLTLDLLSEVGIPQPEERINWYPHQLSGGQVQRIMIAIALACDQLGVIHLGVIQLGVIQFGAIQLGVIQLGVIQLGVIQLRVLFSIQSGFYSQYNRGSILNRIGGLFSIQSEVYSQ